MNEETRAYIEGERAKGTPDETIRDALKTSGWSDADLDTIFNAPKAPGPEGSVPIGTQSFNGSIPYVIAGVLIVLVGGGFWLGFSAKEEGVGALDEVVADVPDESLDENPPETKLPPEGRLLSAILESGGDAICGGELERPYMYMVEDERVVYGLPDEEDRWHEIVQTEEDAIHPDDMVYLGYFPEWAEWGGTRFSSFAITSDAVYANCDEVIEGADPTTFELIGSDGYAKDKDRVYHAHASDYVVYQADPETFRIIEGQETPIYARDDTNLFEYADFYHGGDPDTVEQQFQEFASGGGTWPPTGRYSSPELTSNPLCTVRESYCHEVGYSYTQSACNCAGFKFNENSHTYDSEEFVFRYPTHWSQVSNVAVEGMENPIFILDNNNVSCRLAYGELDETEVGITRSVRMQHYVDGWAGNLLDSYYLQHNESLSPRDKAAGKTATSSVLVPNFPYSSSNEGLILYSPEGDILLEACLREFSDSLVRSDLIHPDILITDAMSGEASVGEVALFEAEERNRYILFRPDDEDKEYIAHTLNFHSRDYQVSGDSLYYLTSDTYDSVRSIERYSFIGEGVETLALPVASGRTINAFYVNDGDVYYVTGPDCIGYLEKCDGTLRFYDAENGSHEIIVSDDINSRRVLGFDDEGLLVLMYGDGDAGCGFSSYEFVDVQAKAVVSEESFSYCVAVDGGWHPQEDYDRVQEIGDSIGGQTAKKMRIENGMITPIQEEEYSSRERIRFLD